MNKCGTCKHWKNHAASWKLSDDGALVAEDNYRQYDPAELAPDYEQWGECQKIEHDFWEWPSKEKERAIAMTMDGSDYRSRLNTRQDFGCVLYEPINT